MKSSTGSDMMSKTEVILRLVVIILGIFGLVVEPTVFQEYVGNQASDLVLIYRVWSLSLIATGCVSFDIGTGGLKLVATLVLHLLVVTLVPMAVVVLIVTSLPELKLVPGYSSQFGIISVIVIVLLLIRILINRLIDEKFQRTYDNYNDNWRF